MDQNLSVINHPYLPQNHSKSDIMDDSIEGHHMNHDSSYQNISKVKKYHHNAKAIANVLKEEKEAQTKLEKQKEQLVLRKQKVASYSKLVKELHWDSTNTKPKNLVYDMNGRKIKKVKSDTHSNKTFEGRRKSKVMPMERVRNMRRKRDDEQRLINDQGNFKENYNSNFKIDSDTGNDVPRHKINSLGQDEDYAIQSSLPQSIKNEDDHNFVGFGQGKPLFP
jgi:hypothetical protein